MKRDFRPIMIDTKTYGLLRELATASDFSLAAQVRQLVRQAHAELQAQRPQPIPDNGNPTNQPAATAG